MNYIAIDPGLKGGYALCYGNGKTAAYPMPVIGGDIDISEIALEFEGIADVVVFIEKVHSMPKQGVASMFKFGMGYGKLIGMCQAMEWQYHLVTPQEWKKYVLKGTEKDKAAAIRVASRLYPKMNLIAPGCRKEHDGMADAMCILYYGMNYR